MFVQPFRLSSTESRSLGSRVEEHARHEVVDFAQLCSRARRMVALLPAFTAAIPARRQTRLERVRKGSAQVTFHRGPFERAVAHVDTALEPVGRLGGDIVDRPARRVLTEQDSLRTLQHLDTFEVETREPGKRGKRQRHLVDVHRDVRVCSKSRLVEADAPQRINGGVVAALREGQTRHDHGEIGDAAQIRVAQRLAGNGADREADLVDRFLPLLRGDEHLLECCRGWVDREWLVHRSPNRYARPHAGSGPGDGDRKASPPVDHESAPLTMLSLARSALVVATEVAPASTASSRFAARSSRGRNSH